jgi:hypothetical protein
MRRIAIALVSLVAGGWLLARPDPVRFLRWPDVQPLLTGGLATGEKLPEFADAKEWDGWIRQRDGEIRGRIDRGIEDSTSALIAFGTSFTTPARLASAAEAVNAAGDLTPNARARLDAFVQAIDRQDSERFRVVLDFLRRRRVTEDEVRAFLAGNLRRYALERAGHQNEHKTTTEAIRAEASLPASYAIEEVLRGLKSKGALTARRYIAVIGPGLDLAGEPDGSDVLPLQTVQPFALLEAVLRLGLAQPAEVQLTSFDVHPGVFAHIRAVPAKARSASRYILQLAHPGAARWNAAMLAYWQHFGEIVGTPAAAATSPSGMERRAIAVKAQYAAHIAAEDLNVVTQTLETAPGRGFDLVVATNVLGYYNPWEQTLALTAIAQMMTSGGILLCNNALPASALREFESLGASLVPYGDDGSGDSVAVYRRR